MNCQVTIMILKIYLKMNKQILVIHLYDVDDKLF